jgi:uncharacterized peroxidase-related enzyme
MAANAPMRDFPPVQQGVFTMSNFPSLPETAHLSDLFKRFPRGVGPLLEFHDAVLRDDSELSIGDRELIAAWVSGLNQCRFCFGAHKLMAQAFDVDPELVDALFERFDDAPLSPRFRLLLRFLEKLTLNPSLVRKRDMTALLESGWSEAAIHDAVLVCALYAFMNRIVEAAGIAPGAEYSSPDPGMVKRRREGSYVSWGRDAGIA